MPAQKTIYILRHAKAETGSSHQDDHERRLTPRGVEAAQRIGQYFVKHEVRPDLVICSSAMRARDTWDGVAQSYTRKVPVEYMDRLYLASANETLQLVSHLPETVSRVMLVGHNPGLHQFCLKIAQQGDEGLMDLLVIKFPTCAFATISLGATPWRDIAQTRGDLKAFITPSMLADVMEE